MYSVLVARLQAKQPHILAERVRSIRHILKKTTVLVRAGRSYGTV